MYPLHLVAEILQLLSRGVFYFEPPCSVGPDTIVYCPNYTMWTICSTCTQLRTDQHVYNEVDRWIDGYGRRCLERPSDGTR